MLKFFRIATEGNTIDGRKITAEHIKQMATNYNPEKFAARIWVEHMRSLLPDGAFAAVGDVLELKTEKNSEDKLVLLARIEPTADLVKMNQNKQKLFTSIELDPNFADSGEAYLVGLAVTDSPASVGTERLAFSAINKEKTLLFSTYHDAAFDFSNNDDVEDEKPSIFNRVKELLGKYSSDHTQKTDSQFSAFYQDITQSIEQVIEDYSSRDKEQKKRHDKLQAQYSELKESFDKLKTELNELPDNADGAYTTRPTAAGGTTDEQFETDC